MDKSLEQPSTLNNVDSFSTSSVTPRIYNTSLCCDYHQEGMDKINAPIILATIRAGHRTYDGKPFQYCPWCGKNIR